MSQEIKIIDIELFNIETSLDSLIKKNNLLDKHRESFCNILFEIEEKEIDNEKIGVVFKENGINVNISGYFYNEILTKSECRLGIFNNIVKNISSKYENKCSCEENFKEVINEIKKINLCLNNLIKERDIELEYILTLKDKINVIYNSDYNFVNISEILKENGIYASIDFLKKMQVINV